MWSWLTRALKREGWEVKQWKSHKIVSRNQRSHSEQVPNTTNMRLAGVNFWEGWNWLVWKFYYTIVSTHLNLLFHERPSLSVYLAWRRHQLSTKTAADEISIWNIFIDLHRCVCEPLKVSSDDALVTFEYVCEIVDVWRCQTQCFNLISVKMREREFYGRWKVWKIFLQLTLDSLVSDGTLGIWSRRLV